MKIVERLLEERRDFEHFSQHELYSLVLSFHRHKMQSEVLYLAEPHILKHMDKLWPT